jgi:orotate phosphoribosyltransferase
MNVLSLVLFGLVLPLAFMVLLWELVMRWTGYKQLPMELAALEARAPASSNAMEEAHAFDFIHAAIPRLEMDLGIYKKIALVKRGFERVSDALTQDVSYSSSRWGQLLQEAATALDRIAPEGELEPLISHATLPLAARFSHSLTEHIDSLRAASAERNADRVTATIGEVLVAIHQWERLSRHWLDLRQSSTDAVKRLSEDEAQELLTYPRRGMKTVFYEPQQGYFAWLQWEGLVKSNLLRDQVDLITEALDHQGWMFDSICSMSTSATPIATLLSVRYNRDFLWFDGAERNFFPSGRPREGEAVLLVDSIAQTGRFLDSVSSCLAELSASAVGAVFLCINDKLPPGRARHRGLDDLLSRERVISLFSISDLWRLLQPRLGASPEAITTYAVPGVGDMELSDSPDCPPPPAARHGAAVKELLRRHQPDHQWARELSELRSLLEVEERP